MNLDELLKKTGRVTAPPSLKQKVMRKIEFLPQEAEAEISPTAVTGWLATAAALVIVIRAIMPTPEIPAKEREELSFYVKEVTAPSTVAPNGLEEFYETADDDIQTFIGDTVEDIFWLKGKENNA